MARYERMFMVIPARKHPDKMNCRMRRYKVFNSRLYKLKMAEYMNHQHFNDVRNKQDVTGKPEGVVGPDDVHTVDHKGYRFYFIPDYDNP